MKYSILVFVFFFSVSSQAEQCKEFSHTTTSSSTGITYDVYLATPLSLEDCIETYILTSDEREKLRFYEEQFGDINPISPEEVAESFFWGFGTYLTFWFIGFKSRAGRQVVKNI